MPDWRAEAIVLSARQHGEDAAVVTLLTESHGRHAGLVRGGQSRRLRPVLQTGNHILANWRARLYDQLGTLQVELLTPFAAHALSHPSKLASIAAMSALIQTALPERDPFPQVYTATLATLTQLTASHDESHWLPLYISWEVGILAAAGFGLALEACAVTGAKHNLAYVSPRTGAAVTEAAAGKYRSKLLPLPRFLGGVLGGEEKPLAQDILDGLRLTSHFIAREFFAHSKPALASPRQRLHAMIEARYAASETPSNAHNAHTAHDAHNAMRASA